MDRHRWLEVGRIVVVGVLVVAYWQGWVPVPVLWLTVALGLYPLAKTGVEDLLHEHKVGTEIFVTLATLTALIGGEAIAGAVLMTIILLAEFVADLNTDRARASIRALIGSAPRTARLRDGTTEREVDVAELRAGDIVLVRAGEQIPVDGTVIGGDGSTGEASITGESVPKDKAVGATVFAGTILESGALDIRTERAGRDTTFARIISLVEHAEESQAPVQKLTDRVASWLIPVVIVFLVAVFLMTRNVRMVVTLMIFTSPAELGLATPMVMIAAIARAARAGILVKGGVHLETLARVDTVVFDKTGTLTVGAPVVRRVKSMTAALSEDQLLALAAAADRRSAHPLAQAVVHHASERGLAVEEPSQFESIPGRGVRATVGGRQVLVGNQLLLNDSGIEPPPTELEASATIRVLVSIDGAFAGIIDLADELRPNAKQALDRLRATGITRIAMLTGDNEVTAKHVAEELGIDEVHAELLPEDKLSVIQTMQRDGHRVAMIGDGVNDAPALATADVGVAMGAVGTQAALEAADIALMTDDLGQILAARTIAAKAYRTIKENLFVGVGFVHVAGIIAALLGLIGPVQAAIIHLGPDLLVFLNSTKLLRLKLDT
jgi:Cd2+/Zn2+-exporting ATPase